VGREIANTVYRTDRSYAWNYGHAPALPRTRRMPLGPGGTLFGHRLNSPLGVAAGPLLNSKWVEGYARLGFDVLTYATVRSRFHPAHSLPNIRHVDNREQMAVTARRHPNGDGSTTIAVSTGLPSMEPDVWRKDVRRAKERIGRGQTLIVSVVGTPEPATDAEAFIADYARCAAWACEAGADAVEVHLAVPAVVGEPGQFVYDNIPLAAQILYGVRTTVSVPVLAKLGLFRSPRVLHETATKLAPWTNGFVLVHGIPRRVVDEEGHAAFEGAGREYADVVGGATFPVSSRQILEMLAWRKAGAWPHAILGVGGLSTPERAQHVLADGADAALVATAALFDPLFAVRFRQAIASAA
jgi:dihydroorotate dehydrogenase (NAD+) catalytic subunit